jgi:hypothetical protein
MSLYIDIRLNNMVVATAAISNTSDLADTSNYSASVTEAGNPNMGIPYLNQAWSLRNHERNQSVWALVETVAKGAAYLSRVAKDKEASENATS